MDKEFYLNKFRESVNRLDAGLFSKQQLELKVALWFDSVVFKIQKPSWLNSSPTAKPFQESIFFSIWISDQIISENKLYYNIHALKLRELKNYTVKSREFADAFRLRFKAYQHKWPNVSVEYGPQTLMEGWVKIDADNFENQIKNFAYGFLEIYGIIDDLLEERRKAG